ncbi:uncharacterized protein SAPINGB_P002287 [Magnusiomyces paraingens]|uniref:Uncharacterized protein n=1 Tax=Magnusiomyces paraingens TaxID=2606893 RepID=A0A5E8BIR9_9ASCO|nr:uncharacterized protein SAPINGB_P002287 [Saprochaete ingens]VVT49473.1 unnamed protein product [Saprochaete ingens]
MSDDEIYNSPIIYDSKTKTVSVDTEKISGWPIDDKAGFTREVYFLNHLAQAMFSQKSQDVPTQGGKSNKDAHIQIEKICVQAAKDLKVGVKDKEAIVGSLNGALALSLGQPPWDSAMTKMQQVVNILGVRCDVNLSRNFWADAAADAEILVMFNAQDWRNHYRRARCLRTIEKYAEAKQEYIVAREQVLLDKDVKKMLQKAIDEIDELI